MKPEKDELDGFEVNIPISAEEFIERVKSKVSAVNLDDPNRFFSTPSKIDYGSIDLYKDKIIVWKLRKLLNRPDNIGTGKIEITFYAAPLGTTLRGALTINDIPNWGLLVIIGFFLIMGISAGSVAGIGLGLFTISLGIVIALISVLLRRDYYINVRSYAMSFIRDIMEN